jgi:carbonic anhydrase
MKLDYPINLGQMIDDVTPSANIFRYDGSLTTPPCGEGVKWHVAVSPTGVSKAEVYAYKFALETVENFRPVQPLNGRVVTKQTPTLPSTWP